MAVGLPLKTTYADGDVYSASDVNDTNGTINANASPYAAGKNKFLNSDFGINQRNFTSTTTNNTYGFDRWLFETYQATGSTTYSTQTFTPGTAPVSGYEGKNFARIVTTGQTGIDAYSILQQRIEDVRTFAGQTVTISFWAKAASGTPSISTVANQAFGTGGSPSATTQVAVAKTAITTSWARYSFQYAVPSLTGKTIGTTANTSYLGIYFWFSAGTAYNAPTGSLGIQTNTFDIWGMQIENGSTATAFQTSSGSIEGELAACQRYYTKTYAQSTAPGTATSTNIVACITPTSGTGSYFFAARFPVTMRGTPTVTAYDSAGASGKVYKGADGKTAFTQQFGDAGGRIGTNDATNTNELLFHYTADAEL
jgi:hypothetical protein